MLIKNIQACPNSRRGAVVMDSPLISIIMPAYNSERFIEDAIRSVLSQTYQNWELLIIDDCSTDDTYEDAMCIAANDPRINVFKNEVNSGAAVSRNNGVSLAKGEYVAFLDSDDLWMPEKLEKQIEIVGNTHADICYTSYSIISASGEKMCNDYVVPKGANYRSLLKENVIGCSTVLLRAEAFSGHLFSTNFYHEDYVLWLELLKSGEKAVGCSDVLASWRCRENSRSYNKMKSLRERWRIYRRASELSIFESGYYMIGYVIAGMKKYSRVKE